MVARAGTFARLLVTDPAAGGEPDEVETKPATFAYTVNRSGQVTQTTMTTPDGSQTMYAFNSDGYVGHQRRQNPQAETTTYTYQPGTGAPVQARPLLQPRHRQTLISRSGRLAPDPPDAAIAARVPMRLMSWSPAVPRIPVVKAAVAVWAGLMWPVVRYWLAALPVPPAVNVSPCRPRRGCRPRRVCRRRLGAHGADEHAAQRVPLLGARGAEQVVLDITEPMRQSIAPPSPSPAMDAAIHPGNRV